MTSTIRELVADSVTFEKPLQLRVIENDFSEFGGTFKVNQRKNGRYNIDTNHYMISMQKSFIPLLTTYVPFNVTLFKEKAVTPGGKKLYLVANGSLHLFPNFDYMIAMNYSIKDVIFIGNWSEFSSIPEGSRLI